MKNVIIGIDLGGTHMRIGTVTKENELIAPLVVDSQQIAEAENPVGKICEIIEDYMRQNAIQNVEAISMGVPSSVENDKETVICTTNIRNRSGEAVFSHMNVARKIREYFQVPAFVNNDINNILLYDVITNHLEKQKMVVGIYIGTGVGASVLMDGKFLEGKNGAELDVGHLPYYGGNIPCSCGKIGCCECYASGWRLQQIREEFYPDTDIQDLFILHGEEEPLREFIHSCANVCAIMTTIFNPDTLIIGGGVIEMAGFPRERFEREVNENTGKDVMYYGFDYLYSQSFVGRGVIGAAMFAREKCRQLTMK